MRGRKVVVWKLQIGLNGPTYDAAFIAKSRKQTIALVVKQLTAVVEKHFRKEDREEGQS